MTAIVLVLFAYLLGSLSFAVIAAKVFGLPDPRTFGSKNPGATNVLRSGKKSAAAFALLGDSVKGYAAVWLAHHFAAGATADNVVVAAALAVFIGHLYPVFFRFQGGKGVATALGVLLALHPWLGVVTLATWLLAALMWRTSSLSALIAAGFAPMYALAIFGAGRYFLAVLVLALLLIYRHRTNIRQLLAGQEGHLGEGDPPGGMPPS